MDRHVERRQPVFDDPLDVVRLEVGERGEVAVAEGEPVVVVPNVEHVAKAVGQAVHEAEVTAVGAAPDPGRLEADADRLAQGSLDVELDLLAVGLAHVQEELLLGGEELPVEEVFQLPSIDREELRAFLETQLGGDRIGMDGGDFEHAGKCRRRTVNSSFSHTSTQRIKCFLRVRRGLPWPYDPSAMEHPGLGIGQLPVELRP